MVHGVPDHRPPARAPFQLFHLFQRRVKIVTKYVLKEHLGPLLFSLSALTSLLLLNYVAKQLGQLVGKGLHWSIIAEFLLLSVPFTLAMTFPMAVLVATLHAFSRMAAENEITAFKASGFSMHRLMVPVIVSAGFLTLFMIWFNDQVLPRSNHKLATLSQDIARVKPTFALKEQVINEVSPGKLFLWTSNLAANSNRMKDVTIYDMGDPTRRRTIRADSGLLEMTSNGRDLLLTLFDGSMTELTQVVPTRVQRMFFRTDLIKVKNIGNSLERDSVGGEKSDREMTVCELQSRVARASRMQDSAYAALTQLSPKLAKEFASRRTSGGLGGLYCRLSAKLSAMGSVKSASAAPAQAPAQASVRVTLPPAVTLPQPPEQVDSAQIYIVSMGLKMQLMEAQRIIDGNQVEIEKKFAIAAACIIFALFGAPIALRFPRGGVGLTIGVSLCVFGLYYVGLIVGEEFARRNLLSPVWAMWTTNIGLLVVGLYLIAKLGSEGSTSRGSESSDLLDRIRDWFRRGREVA